MRNAVNQFTAGEEVMNDPKPTPGPWESLTVYSYNKILNKELGVLVASVGGRTQEECLANSAIIESSFEMLEVLEQMVKVRPDIDSYELWQKAAAVVKKARRR